MRRIRLFVALVGAGTLLVGMATVGTAAAANGASVTPLQ